jgi:outer membrane protein OmpA-like peptidoglycan-associated protein
MKRGAVLFLLLSAVIVFSVAAQSPKGSSTRILKGDELTESALIDALVPPPATRGFSREPAGKTAAKPNTSQAVRAAQASLLIEFETNSTQLTPEAKQQLDIVGRALNTSKLTSFNFVLEGHADPRGSAAWNQKLSEGRAAAVRQYLVANQNVDGDRLRPIGKGDREPLNLRNPAAPENRRVTILTVSN